MMAGQAAIAVKMPRTISNAQDERRKVTIEQTEKACASSEVVCNGMDARKVRQLRAWIRSKLNKRSGTLVNVARRTENGGG